MKRTYTIMLTMCVVALFATSQAFAQSDGDYRSAGVGDWSDPGIWEVYNGTEWEAATDYPDGTQDSITVAGGDTVTVDSDVSATIEGDPVDGTLVIDNYLTVQDSSVLEVGEGELIFFDGSTYDHARDGGSIPEADWWVGSTIEFTGLINSGPDNRAQAYSNIVWNNPDQDGNVAVGWGTVTITGNIRVVDTGSARFHMTDSGSGDGQTITIEGDVIVEGGQFTTTGSGGSATYETVVMGNVEVHDGGNLAPSRGSGGFSTWNVHGDFTVVEGATLQNSNSDDRGGFTFVSDTTGGSSQLVNVSSETNYNGAINFFVPDTSVIEVEAGGQFYVEDTLSNSGSIVTNDTSIVIVGNGGVYVHARDGGDVPTATWEEGSTALFSGITGNSPGNANQDYYNIVFNSPNNTSNEHFGMDGNTISGDIEIVSTGASNRFYLTSPSSDPEETREITIMGDITMESGQFSTNGSSGTGPINVHHYGNITVNDGNFSVSRGSGPVVSWFMYEGDLIFNGGESQSSNARAGNAFVFTGADTVTHNLTLSEDFDMSALPVVVETGATLDIGTSNFNDSGENFEVRSGATLATADTAGFGDNLALGGSGETVLTLSTEANYVLNGTEAQVSGNNLPLTVASLTIDNEAGVALTRMVTITDYLRLASGVLDNTIPFDLGDDADIIVDGGTLLIPAFGVGFEVPEPPYEIGDTLNYNGSFSTADLGDTSADAWLIEGTDGSSWEIVDDAADEDDRALEFNVVHVGEDWHSSQAVNEPINVVEGETYRASASLKADEDGRIVRFYAGMPESGDWERARGWETPQLELTTDYVEYDFEFTATEAQETNQMRLAFEYNIEANDGAVIYIDDVVLEKVESVSNEITEGIPNDFALRQNYPNPFNPTTNIQYDVPEQSHVTLKVYDITGREVAELVNKNHSAGVYTQSWDASSLASGMYIYRITAGDFTAVRKLTLIK
ncbi:MAG: T9SS type A sorting domain-containing protein [Balneolaceae bacterium]